MYHSRITRRALGATVAGVSLLGATSRAAGQEATPEAEYENGVQSDGSWRFRDDRGYDIHLPQMPTRIVSSIESGAALLDYGVEVLGVVGTFADATGWRDEGAGDLDESSVQYLGEWDSIDLEAILALDAELYVDVTYDPTRAGSYSVSDSLADLMEQTVPTLAIAVGGGVKLPTPLERFEELATALGVETPPQAMVDAKAAFQNAEATARQVFTEKSDLVTALVAVGHIPDQMVFWDPSEFADILYYQDLGLNVLPIDPSVGYTLEVSIEEATMFEYDVALNRIEPEDLFAELENYPTLEFVPAVSSRQVYKWTTVYPPSYRGFLPVIEALITNIGDSEKVVS